MDVYEACIVSIGQKTYPTVLYDTAGQEAYDRLRPITYPSVFEKFKRDICAYN